MAALLIAYFNPAVAAEEERISRQELEQLAPFPEFYEQMSPEGRLDWLNSQIDQTTTPAQNYNFQRALAFEHFFNYRNSKAQDVCDNNPPLSFDIRYRFACIQVSDLSYEKRIDNFLELYETAIEEDDTPMAARVLTSMGWYQSGKGDIAAAFKSYEEALSMGESLDFFTLNDAMVNTASLYIIHGDKDYIRKGIELHKQSIERIRQRASEDPEFAETSRTAMIIPQFNIGIAYALHTFEYEKALEWFEIINASNTEIPHLKFSSLIFSALSAIEIGRTQLAEQYLARTYDEPAVNNTEFSYLYCYRELVKFKLGQEADLDVCLPLHENVPLEVKIDVYKRISELNDDAIKYAGMEQFYKLFDEKLESQLKQSSTSVASTAELHRLQQESRLRNELLEKEIALKEAQQERREDQIRLVVAIAFILLLLVVITVIRLNQKRRLAEQYEELSVLDVLTGLKNRRFLEQNIGREMSFVKRSQANQDGHALGIYLLDIDHFKYINDTYGHEAGDQILIEFTQRINDTIRDTDLFVRWGGEEFLLVARLDNADGLQVLAERVIQAIKQDSYAAGQGKTVDITCTVGSVVYPCVENPEKHISWNKLVQLADLALYYGKEKQRDCWVCIEKISNYESRNTVLELGFEESLRQGLLTFSTSISKPE
ncbi:tetratricopeptide repeat-containing diguanylate cyclase [Kangiella koreensis]|uniref:diguanylate cyclase n=1 Tax=Kangiella koreensis (strain DSM 16069 / JCM 12317 / KCTC 12182 / SW-125) TaxID=523791 RepID=C7RBB9_KANKD|nr:GGDEF domain-containing protein [Kangiella koreensis]ACV26561.1 diguanylate cyclase [Kangiella koreensis DSM 16069]